MNKIDERLRRATPLVSITALVLDTETTGLNPSKDQIVQIGAVKIENGKCDYKNCFDELVKPAIAIPNSSTEIHGITDEDVSSENAFIEVANKLGGFFNPPLIIGYSIGFDIGFFKSEFARAGKEWTAPATLDVQLLAQYVTPQLPDRSLETLAAWLDIPTEDRHNALADAIMTARVFKALLPKLAEKSIFTFAEAVRVTNRLAPSNHIENAWHDIRDEDTVRARGVNEFARIDSFPYRHNVADLMSTPPAIVPKGMTLKNVLSNMNKENVSSVFVEASKSRNEYGIFTNKDILRLIDAKGEKILSEKVGFHISRPLIGVLENDHLYKAMNRMTNANISHLAVYDDHGTLSGAITARDMLKQRAIDASILGDNINTADSPEALAEIWPLLTRTARSLVFEQVDPRNIASIISHELRALTKRACELATDEMITKGRGKPPCDWAMLVLGSAGRGESLLAMDQDNAIIFERGDPGGKNDEWFEEMATHATLILNQVGVPLCKGDIMASNPEWRMNQELWHKNIQNWIERSNPQDILNCDIFFDAASVTGNSEMLHDIEAKALKLASGSRNFIKLLSMNALNFPTSIGWFGKIKTENGRLDIKRAGLMPIFSTARVLALKHGLSVNATPDRLDAVKAHESEQEHVLENLKNAHRIFLEAILKQQLLDIDVGIPLSNNVSPNQLNGYETEELRWALEQVRSIPDLLGGGLINF